MTPGKRRVRSLLKVLWRGLESVGRHRAARALEDAAAGVQGSRPELARELRAASANLLLH